MHLFWCKVERCMKKVVRRKNIDFTKYVNTTTGETLNSEQPDALYLQTKTDRAVIEYSSYVVIDREVMEFLTEILSIPELGRVNILISDTKGCKNIIMKDDVPHDNITLAKRLSYTRNKYTDFMNKMYKASIVYKISGYKEGQQVQYFILNPYIARATKTTDASILPCFENLTKTDAKKRVIKALKQLEQ